MARELGVRPAAGVRASRHGGDGPVALVDEAAKKIAGGECRVVVVAGGEALGSGMYVFVCVWGGLERNGARLMCHGLCG